jgi:hypothetical protein
MTTAEANPTTMLISTMISMMLRPGSSWPARAPVWPGSSLSPIVQSQISTSSAAQS